jgi:hypothetical protein
MQIWRRQFFALDCVCPRFKDKRSMGKKPKSLRMLQRGLFPSHKIILWVCSKEASGAKGRLAPNGSPSLS